MLACKGGVESRNKQGINSKGVGESQGECQGNQQKVARAISRRWQGHIFLGAGITLLTPPFPFCPRVSARTQKLKIQTVTVEAGKLDAQARSAQLAADVQRADEFFRMLGWGAHQEGAGSRELLNKLIM